MMVLAAFILSLGLNWATINFLEKRKVKLYILPLTLFSIPLLMFLFIGFDGRLIGLGIGLIMVITGSVVAKKFDLPYYIDIFFLAIAGLIAYRFGFKIQFITNPEGGFYYLSFLSLPFTVIWIVVVSQSLELLGRFDSKLVFPVTLISCTVFFIVHTLLAQSGIFAIYLIPVILGCALGLFFKPVRANPSFSKGLGFLFALLSTAGMLKVATTMSLVSPFMILSMPVMTTSLGFVYPQRQITQGGLLGLMKKRGISTSGAVFLLYLISSFLCVSLIILPRWVNVWSISFFVGIPLLGSLVFAKRDVFLEGGFQALGSRVYMSGIPIDRLSSEEVIKKMDDFIKFNMKGKTVATPDTTSLMRARINSKIKEVYKKADLVTADGIGIVWASRFLGQPLPERVTGIDMIFGLCRLAASKKYRIFLLGGRENVAQKAKAKLEVKFPGLNIVGTHHGYFDQNSAMISKIRKANPDILLVGMGFPKQEKWMIKQASKTGTSVAIGVGGSFDVISGEKSRAPKIVQKMGLEWFYRLMLEPRRLARSFYIPLFILNTVLFKILKHS